MRNRSSFEALCSVSFKISEGEGIGLIDESGSLSFVTGFWESPPGPSSVWSSTLPEVSLQGFGSIPIRSFTAAEMRWVQPRCPETKVVGTWSEIADLQMHSVPDDHGLLNDNRGSEQYHSTNSSIACR
jgi:hypothetical protein